MAKKQSNTYLIITTSKNIRTSGQKHMENYLRTDTIKSPELKSALLEFKELSKKTTEKVELIEKIQEEVQELLQEGESIKRDMIRITNDFNIELNVFEVINDVNLVSEEDDDIVVKIMDNQKRWEEAYLNKVNGEAVAAEGTE